jgi:hypothetical protein
MLEKARDAPAQPGFSLLVRVASPGCRAASPDDVSRGNGRAPFASASGQANFIRHAHDKIIDGVRSAVLLRESARHLHFGIGTGNW